jgi:hypothetical protein
VLALSYLHYPLAQCVRVCKEKKREREGGERLSENRAGEEKERERVLEKEERERGGGNGASVLSSASTLLLSFFFSSFLLLLRLAWEEGEREAVPALIREQKEKEKRAGGVE